MQTFYVDVYFLINFTVDILALYIAVRVARVKTGVLRLSACAFIGACAAVIDFFAAEYLVIRLAVVTLSIILLARIITKRASLRRRIKLLAVFLAAMLLLGGGVSLGYSILDRIFGESLEGMTGAENRGALILAVLVLLSIGVVKLLIMIFSDMLAEKSVRVSITIADTTVEADALVDSGNLVKDPMSMRPVLFIKPSLAERLVPRCVADLSDLDLLDEDYRRRIRLIPVSGVNGTHVMTGVRPDRVLLFDGRRQEEVLLTVAIDKEGGTYGGYEALAPLAAIRDAF